MTTCLSVSTYLTVLHVPEIVGQPKKVLMFLWRSQNRWRDSRLPRKKKTEQLEFEAWPNFGKFPDLAKERQNWSFSGASRPVEATIWINDIESVKSIADLKTSNTITGRKLQTNFEVLDS